MKLVAGPADASSWPDFRICANVALDRRFRSRSNERAIGAELWKTTMRDHLQMSH